MGGGRGIPILISTPAIVGIGTTITNAKSIVPKSNFFILLPPILIKKGHLSHTFSNILHHLVWSPRHIYDAFDVLFRSFIQLPTEMFPQIFVECHHQRLLKGI